MPDSLGTALVKDKNLKKRLMDMIKMLNTYLIEYERNLVETAEKSTTENIAREMKQKGYPREEILDITGIDILKM